MKRRIMKVYEVEIVRSNTDHWFLKLDGGIVHTIKEVVVKGGGKVFVVDGEHYASLEQIMDEFCADNQEVVYPDESINDKIAMINTVLRENGMKQLRGNVNDIIAELAKSIVANNKGWDFPFTGNWLCEYIDDVMNDNIVEQEADWKEAVNEKLAEVSECLDNHAGICIERDFAKFVLEVTGSMLIPYLTRMEMGMDKYNDIISDIMEILK